MIKNNHNIVLTIRLHVIGPKGDGDDDGIWWLYIMGVSLATKNDCLVGTMKQTKDTHTHIYDHVYIYINI